MRHSSPSKVWETTTPSPASDASVWNINSFDKSGLKITGSQQHLFQHLKGWITFIWPLHILRFLLSHLLCKRGCDVGKVRHESPISSSQLQKLPNLCFDYGYWVVGQILHFVQEHTPTSHHISQVHGFTILNWQLVRLAVRSSLEIVGWFF